MPVEFSSHLALVFPQTIRLNSAIIRKGYFGLIMYCIYLFAVLTTLTVSVLSKKSGCPEPIDVSPCKCTNSPFTYLECQHLDDSNVLKQVFDRSSGYTFREVHIEYSSLQFLPRDMFDEVEVSSLHLKNVTVNQLFDGLPNGLDKLETLHIEATKILRSITADLLKPLTHLRFLSIYYNWQPIIGPELTDFISRELQQFTFYDTSTKYIKSGTFKDFVNLDKVAFEACKLTELSRDIFPTPFNVRYLYFSKNNIATIPDNLFNDMPNLQTVGLRNNHITVLPSTLFRGNLAKLQYLMLDGNPIICDCRIEWLVKNHPEVLSGQCDAPNAVRGKKITDLTTDFLDC